MTRPRTIVEQGEWMDELAIDAACNGFRQSLNKDEQREAVKRMYGQVEVDLLAYYIGTTRRQVQRLRSELEAMA